MANATEQPIRVLLIEDNEIDRMFVKRLLESNPEMPFTIDHADRLSDALAKLQANDYDVAMLDLNLPDAGGLESFDQIRALDARLPVVVLTGSDDEELGLLAIESGAQDFIAKGHITGQMLFRAVRFAIARQRKVMGFKAAADTDPLTGMPNRRHLESMFKEMASAAQNQGAPMSVALLDVDHFKRINDQFGHFIGDAVLKEVAMILTDAAPSGTAAARFGGEEFALLMPEFGLENARKLVESILKRMAKTEMIFDDAAITVTASAGVTEINFDESWDQSYVKADAALYQSKTSGRNCCHCHQAGPIPTQPTV